ncbi:hypothetical protein [Paraburkholderia sp. 2C]|jgi:hypothetical protein
MTSATHHDLESGNRLALPWLGGGVAPMGEALNAPTPGSTTIADNPEPSAGGHTSG